MAEWRRQGSLVFSRALRYHRGGPPQEKGIDVQLAVDFVAGAVSKNFDIGMIFSTDTDLLPPLEFLVEHPELGIQPAVAAWWSPAATPALTVSGAKIEKHHLRQEDYERVRDMRSYPQ